MKTNKGYELTRVKNDVNGNPRYAIHFLALLSDSENASGLDISERYALALKKSRAYGGRKYHTKSYGGGIVFQSYNTNELIDFINKKCSENNHANN